VSICELIHENDAALDGIMRESFTAEMNVGRSTVTHYCGAGKDTHHNEVKQCLGEVNSDRHKTGLPDSRSTPTNDHAVAHSLSQLDFHLLKQLSSISTTLRTPNPSHQSKIGCIEKPK
jgi:hypothetical protein